ncbi:hypothetical protein F2P81_005274 [Scophthalmus maximus]|uniref:Uncharacterized protein n=1 Tax=Scophthalmus maximus TaxID=52904 RepID=A0A6A4TI33_SCOMX|nr:hypothetical protein F2P81_005274 [Scophthalmus maximus]
MISAVKYELLKLRTSPDPGRVGSLIDAEQQIASDQACVMSHFHRKDKKKPPETRTTATVNQSLDPMRNPGTRMSIATTVNLTEALFSFFEACVRVCEWTEGETLLDGDDREEERGNGSGRVLSTVTTTTFAEATTTPEDGSLGPEQDATRLPENHAASRNCNYESN